MSGKLTKAERDLLKLAAQGELEISHNHPVAHALDARGLLKIGGHIWRGFNILFSRSARITEAGHNMLSQTDHPHDQHA